MKNFNFREKIAQFMSGRYGMDQLNNTLMVAALILIILEMLIKSQIVGLIGLVIMVYTMFRSYSRDHAKRAEENKKFRKLLKPVRRSFSVMKMKIKERGTNRFRTCPNCKVIIRTSKERGTRVMTCPRCKTEFKTRIY